MFEGAYVYVLRCVDGSYYTGTARQGLEQRVAEHNAGHHVKPAHRSSSFSLGDKKAPGPHLPSPSAPWFTGRVTVQVVPWPGVLVSSIRPPWG